MPDKTSFMLLFQLQTRNTTTHQHNAPPGLVVCCAGVAGVAGGVSFFCGDSNPGNTIGDACEAALASSGAYMSFGMAAGEAACVGVDAGAKLGLWATDEASREARRRRRRFLLPARAKKEKEKECARECTKKKKKKSERGCQRRKKGQESSKSAGLYLRSVAPAPPCGKMGVRE